MEYKGISITNCFETYKIDNLHVVKDESGNKIILVKNQSGEIPLNNESMWYFNGVKDSPKGPYVNTEVAEILDKLKRLDPKAAKMDRENFIYGLFGLGYEVRGILPVITPTEDSRYKS